MSVALKIVDETSSGEVIHESIIQFPAQTVSVRALIEARVKAEVDRYHSSSDKKRFFGLVQPSDSEVELNGYSRKNYKKIDVVKQQKIAIDAFESNGFFLLVNDQQLTGLDDDFIITPNTSVSFIKLIPLVGG